MSNSVKVGREAVAHGTLAAALVSIPCAFSTREQQKNTTPEETRNSQDEHFVTLAGLNWHDFAVKESMLYHDTIGYWLASAMGAPVVAAIESIAVTSSSVANPSIITTGAAHGFVSGQTATITGHTGATPSINANHVVTVISPTTFSIPINVTIGGTGGTCFVVRDATFKLAADPASLSLQWDDPRRSAEPMQALYACADKFEVKFSADGSLTYAVDGVSLVPTVIAAPTYSFSAVHPFEAWRGAVTLDGAASFARLISGSVTITRNRKPFHAIRNNQNPSRISIGKRAVEVEMVLDFNALTELADWRTAAQTAGLTITWTDTSATIGVSSNPIFEVKLGTLLYTDTEKDWAPDEPRLKVNAQAIYNATDASSIVVRVRSFVDYT